MDLLSTEPSFLTPFSFGSFCLDLDGDSDSSSSSSSSSSETSSPPVAVEISAFAGIVLEVEA